MKTLLSWIFIMILAISTVKANDGDFEKLVAAARSEFDKEFGTEDFENALTCIEKALKIKPDDAYATYIYGFTLSKLNSRGGLTILDLDVAATIKSSLQFEKVIALDPEFEGDLQLDPYGKITSDWGALAIKYMYENKADSVLYAFEQGRNRGGFSDFTLALYRQMLNECRNNSLLFTYGDIPTMVTLYLQNIQNYRTDVLVVDQSLIGAKWYRDRWVEGKILDTLALGFDLPSDSVGYIEITPKIEELMHIKRLKWHYNPTYRGFMTLEELRFIGIVNQNIETRHIYQTFRSLDPINELREHVRHKTFLFELSVSNNSIISPYEFNKKLEKLYSLAPLINLKNASDLFTFEVCLVNAASVISKVGYGSEPEKIKDYWLIFERHFNKSGIKNSRTVKFMSSCRELFEPYIQ